MRKYRKELAHKQRVENDFRVSSNIRAITNRMSRYTSSLLYLPVFVNRALFLQELQTDYQRFMDYTDGKYHSDYMMHLRQYGLDIAKKRISVVTYEDIEELK